MAATNYICCREFVDKRGVRALPGMVVSYDPAVAQQLLTVNAHLKHGVILLASDTANKHPIMVTLQKLAVPPT
jgi:hypothetical protein